MARMNMAKDLVYSGALFQITAGSFTGMFGRDVKKCAVQYAKMGMVHFVGSDAHSFKGRTPSLSKGLRVLGKLTGENIFRQYNELGLTSETWMELAAQQATVLGPGSFYLDKIWSYNPKVRVSGWVSSFFWLDYPTPCALFAFLPYF